ncbi:MAG: hypothetical protein AVDCRST_MAG48-1103, partial [uncultured Friedmanniella sp.]
AAGQADLGAAPGRDPDLHPAVLGAGEEGREPADQGERRSSPPSAAARPPARAAARTSSPPPAGWSSAPRPRRRGSSTGRSRPSRRAASSPAPRRRRLPRGRPRRAELRRRLHAQPAGGGEEGRRPDLRRRRAGSPGTEPDAVARTRRARGVGLRRRRIAVGLDRRAARGRRRGCRSPAAPAPPSPL